VKLAVIGLGSAGRRHAQHALELGHEVVGFDPAAGEPPGVWRADSAESAIAAADAVVVSSPSSFHAQQALVALEAGKPTLVEKPLAASVEDAERIVETARALGVACGVAMNLRFHCGILGLRDLLPELGEVRLARSSFGYDLPLWRPDIDYRASYSARAELGGGILLDAIHELDYLLWLLGPVNSVSAELDRVSDLEIDVEDTALLALKFESGALGAVDLNFLEPAYRRECLLVGSGAVAHWDWNSGKISLRRREDTRTVDATCDVAETYRAVLEDFLSAADSGGEPRTPPEDGAAALRLVEAGRRSSAEGCRASVAGRTA
jgi:predicted dehydrogenase